MKYFLLKLFRLNKYKGSPPEIIEIDKPIKVLGVSKRTNKKTVLKDVAELSDRYKNAKSKKLIKYKKEPWAFVVISKNFDKKDSWDYIIGDVVANESNFDNDLTYFEIPPSNYAIFKITFSSRLNLRDNISSTKNYFYKKWLPYSSYRHDDSALSDFELHDIRCLDKKNPEIELWFPIATY
ncbi:MAG: hypothetical protein A2X12_07620 [Bacteroidetes bacterium GWE2_29_8]|nr:MAG: hypothetical protein A2X12_07620 [Bacteroidetes bacterium GWE2_29_8]OFY22736.1 MAG: hypothetical protein A2X02_02165 [Bacteroidetes bacterium GWF2_29_10]